MKVLQTATAVIEPGAGFALLCFPSITVELLLGAPLETPATLTARVGGAGLLALGVACWLARGDTQSRAARGLVAAMLLYDVAAVAVLAFAGHRIAFVSRPERCDGRNKSRARCRWSDPGQCRRSKKRCALLDSLLGEWLRHHYYDDAAVSQTLLVEARKAVTAMMGPLDQ